jgi:hypothetical protein
MALVFLVNFVSWWLDAIFDAITATEFLEPP